MPHHGMIADRALLQMLTARVIEYKFWLQDERARTMGRLDEKWAQAGGVVGEVEKHIENKLDALIARKAEIKTKTDTVFAKQAAPIDEADRALDALDAKLNLLSNGGPTDPLPGSGSSPAVEQAEQHFPHDPL